MDCALSLLPLREKVAPEAPDEGTAPRRRRASRANPHPQPLSRRRGETELSLQKLCGPVVSEVAGDIGGGLAAVVLEVERGAMLEDRKSTRLNSSHRR